MGSAAGAPRKFQPLLRRLRLRHKNSARASGGPAGGRRVGGMLGAMANIVAAGARPRNFQPLLRRLRLRHKSSARAFGGLAGGRRVRACLGDGAHCRLHHPCTAAERFSNRRDRTIPARVAADILACNKFSQTDRQTDRRELLRIENYRKPTRMSRSHSRSVKGPPCEAGLAPGTQEPHRPPPTRAVNNFNIGIGATEHHI